MKEELITLIEIIFPDAETVLIPFPNTTNLQQTTLKTLNKFGNSLFSL